MNRSKPVDPAARRRGQFKLAAAFVAGAAAGSFAESLWAPAVINKFVAGATEIRIASQELCYSKGLETGLNAGAVFLKQGEQAGNAFVKKAETQGLWPSADGPCSVVNIPSPPQQEVQPQAGSDAPAP